MIRYTLDGSNPGLDSPVYSTPLDLTATTTVKVRVSDGTRLGAITTATYLRIPASPPNVLMIVGDDFGFNDLECYGGVSAATPRLNGLAYEGQRFTQFTTTGPGDAVNQYALLTARLAKWGDLAPVIQPNSSGIDSREWTLAEAFRKSGYHTAFIGSWQLDRGHRHRHRPIARSAPNLRRFQQHACHLPFRRRSKPERHHLSQRIQRPAPGRKRQHLGRRRARPADRPLARRDSHRGQPSRYLAAGFAAHAGQHSRRLSARGPAARWHRKTGCSVRRPHPPGRRHAVVPAPPHGCFPRIANRPQWCLETPPWRDQYRSRKHCFHPHAFAFRSAGGPH